MWIEECGDEPCRGARLASEAFAQETLRRGNLPTVAAEPSHVYDTALIET